MGASYVESVGAVQAGGEPVVLLGLLTGKLPLSVKHIVYPSKCFNNKKLHISYREGEGLVLRKTHKKP